MSDVRVKSFCSSVSIGYRSAKDYNTIRGFFNLSCKLIRKVHVPNVLEKQAIFGIVFSKYSIKSVGYLKDQLQFYCQDF